MLPHNACPGDGVPASGCRRFPIHHCTLLVGILYGQRHMRRMQVGQHLLGLRPRLHNLRLAARRPHNHMRGQHIALPIQRPDMRVVGGADAGQRLQLPINCFKINLRRDGL